MLNVSPSYAEMNRQKATSKPGTPVIHAAIVYRVQIPLKMPRSEGLLTNVVAQRNNP